MIWTVSSEEARERFDQKHKTAVLELTRPDLAGSIEDLGDPCSMVVQCVLQVAPPSRVGTGFFFELPYHDDAHRVRSYQCDRCLRMSNTSYTFDGATVCGD